MYISKVRADQTCFEQVQQKLRRLMPFDEWCRAVNPTQSALEMYEFVRHTLERELEGLRRMQAPVLAKRETRGTPRRRLPEL